MKFIVNIWCWGLDVICHLTLNRPLGLIFKLQPPNNNEGSVIPFYKMAPQRSGKKSSWKKYIANLSTKDLISFTKSLLFEPKNTWIVAAGLLFAEIFVNIFVIQKVRCKFFVKDNTAVTGKNEVAIGPKFDPST